MLRRVINFNTCICLKSARRAVCLAPEKRRKGVIESLITDVVSKKAEKRMPTHHDTSDAHQQQRAEFSGGAYMLLRTTFYTVH